jgi:hypothetical protein
MWMLTIANFSIGDIKNQPDFGVAKPWEKSPMPNVTE